MHQPHQIELHTSIRRKALAEGKSVLARLDRIGNVMFSELPIVFDTPAELRAYRDSNKQYLYSPYYGSTK